MRSTTGMVVLAVISLIAAAGAAAYGWQMKGEAEAAKRELASTVAALDKIKTDLAAAKEEANAMRKDLTEQKAAVQQLRSEIAAADAFLQAEKAVGMRLRMELSMANEKLALIASSRGRPTITDVRTLPMPVQIRPSRIEAASPGVARSVAVPAQAPGAAPSPGFGYAR